MNRTTWPLAVLLTLSGLLWAVHGTLTMLKPWGEESRYSESRGYSLVVDQSAFLAYNTPGAAALLLSALALLALRVRVLPERTARPPLAKAGTVLIVLAALLGAGSVVGVAVLSDPVFTATRVAGALLLGIGAAAIASAAADTGSAWSRWLLVVGLLALGLMPLWPLVYAVTVLPEWGGAVYFAVFGATWLAGAARLREPVTG